MSDGGPPPGMSFPQKVHTEEEDFVIELDENHMVGPHDGYGMDDRSRCKRRKRCGQCGPCQVKENCMKCHFCIRKDVLKQTCIYRKCVYLRSKPKPYARPHQSPQGRASPSRDVMQASPVLKSPPNVQTHPGMPFPDAGMHMPEARQENHPFFPAQLPQPSPLPAPQQNNGYVSPPNPVMDNRTPSLPNHTAATINMQMSASPHLQNATSPSIQKLHDAASPGVPHPVHSPMVVIPGIPTPVSSCSNITPHMPSMPHMGPVVPSVFSQPMSSSSLANIPPIPALPSMSGINDRTMNEFRPPDQFPLPPHHPHPHYPPVHPHPHMPSRDPGLFGDHSRVPHMNFNTPNPMETFARGPNDSSCMYHPRLQYSMPGHFQPSGPSFIPGAAEINPFRSNFLNSFPPGYSYPPDRYREGFGPLPFSRLGMSPSTTFPQYPGQGHGYGMGNSFSQQYYNSQHGCPKNGSRPPVSPSTDDVKVLQDGYKNEISPKSKSSDPCSPHYKVSDMCSPTSAVEEDLSREGRMSSDQFMPPTYNDYIHHRPRSNFGEISPRMDHLRAWSEFYLNKTFGRPDGSISSQSAKSFGRNDSVSSQNSRLSLWEPWRIPSWFSPRRDDVRSRASTSTLSSDFECEVISIDDHQMNALIRSDGCNSIEIEFDNGSLCSNEDSSPRKLTSTNSSMSDFASPMKSSYFQPIDRLLISEPRSVFSPWSNDGPAMTGSGYGSKALEDEGLIKITKNTVSSGTRGTDCAETETREKHSKLFIKGSVCIRQDLGDEGTMQLELPGHKVTIEDAVLGDDLEKQCSDLVELKKFINSVDRVQVDMEKYLACV